MYQQRRIWNMKPLLACMFGCMCVCMAARQSECPHVFVRERERQRRERGSLSPRKSVKNSPSLCPVKRFMNLSIGCVYAQLCAHLHTQRCQWAFMSMFKLSIWDRLSLWGKWTNQTDRNQLKTSTCGLPMGRGRFPRGAKSTNNVLTHEAMGSLDDTIYEIAYAKMALACAEYHMRKWPSKAMWLVTFIALQEKKHSPPQTMKIMDKKLRWRKKNIKAIKSNRKVGWMEDKKEDNIRMPQH